MNNNTNNTMNYNCKKVVTNLYFHKSNTPAVMAQSDEFRKALGKAMVYMDRNKYPWEVIKLNTKEGRFSLINAVGWDKLYEPVVGDSYIFDEDGYFVKVIKGNRQVYHQKHLFVADDYTGFDIQKSIKRTETIEALPEIRETKGIKSKIGSLYFWNEFRSRNELPAYMEGVDGSENALHDFQTICGVQVDEIPIMKNFFRTHNPMCILDKYKEFCEEYDFLMTSYMSALDGKKSNTIKRLIHILLEEYFQRTLDMFVTLYRPWNSTFSGAETFITIDGKFVTRRFNNYWYMLPIVSNTGHIITSKTPDELEVCPIGYDSRIHCMWAHFIERMKIFNM